MPSSSVKHKQPMIFFRSLVPSLILPYPFFANFRILITRHFLREDIVHGTKQITVFSGYHAGRCTGLDAGCGESGIGPGSTDYHHKRSTSEHRSSDAYRP